MNKKKKLLWMISVGCIVLAAASVLGVIRADARHAAVTLLGDASVTVEYGGSFTDPGAEAYAVGSVFKKTSPLPVTVSGEVDITHTGITELTYTAEYRGVSASAIRTVTVVDTVPPTIELTNDPGERDYLASDNYDGDLRSAVVREEQEGRIVYTVSDSSGNTATAERSTVPAIELTGGESVQIAADYKFSDPGYTARDLYGRDLTASVEVTGLESLTPWKLGSYELTYSVSDEYGHSSSVTRSVEIVPAELPETVKKDKVIYLTFDDGPSFYTEELLDVLKKYDAKATFFVTAFYPDYFDMIGRAYAEGHAIGVHGYVHDGAVIYRSEEAYFENFDTTEELIYEQTGSYSRLVRFPGGTTNKNCPDGMMRTLSEDLTNMGYRYFDWNVQPENEESNVLTLINGVKYCVPNVETPVVLQHDTNGYSVHGVELILQWGIENGYTFEALDMTTPPVEFQWKS